MPQLPSGTVTFVFTDIEGSTRLWEAHPEAMRVALARHDAVVREAVESAGGYVFKTVGDAFCVAFAAATDGVQAAVAVQRLLVSEVWPEPVVIRVRMALHTGECVERDGDYFGLSVNRVARLEATAHGGQIVLSGVTAGLVGERFADGMTLRDLGEHRLKDLGRTERVFQVCGVGLDDEFPPLRSLTNPALRHNLPRYSSRLVGRVDDVRAIAERVAPGRLVTLVGPGGTGKTRLAVHAAVEMLDGSGDGVWLVEFAPVDDVELVARTVASVLGVRGEPGRPILESLVDALASQRLLIVLDNCEHVADGVAKLAARVLSECPNVALLATSREPLAIDGEQLFRVAPLSIPREDADPVEIEASEAVQLFVERAAAHRPKFRLDARNGEAIAAVCRRVDGIPLAIELAAARLRALSINEIVERLDERLGLLTGGSRTALPRQQTLRALIDWSYNLLDARERALLAGLSVFAGGWTLAGAEAVGAGADVQPPEIVDLLAALVDKSLVETTEVFDGTSRYRMLETIREYATERLHRAGHADVVGARRAHQEHYIDVAQRARPELVGPDQIEWYHRLHFDDDNFRLALANATNADERDDAIRLIAALTQYWMRTGHARDVIHPVELIIAGEPPPTASLAEAYGCAGLLHDHLGNLAAASQMYEQGLALARHLGDAKRAAECMAGQARMTWRRGQLDEALAAASEACALAQTAADDHLLGYCEMQLGAVQTMRAEFEAARAHNREALRLLRGCGDLCQIGNLLGNAANLEVLAGDLDQALVHATECEEIFTAWDDPRSAGIIAHTIGMIHDGRGNRETALEKYRESLALCQRAGDRLMVAAALIACAHILAETRPEEAAALCGFYDADSTRNDSFGEPDEREHRRQAEATSRVALGPDRYDLQYQHGTALSVAEAAALARAAQDARETSAHD
jgi:predicted ATPase/class 3 adenylate cyclase